MVCVGVSLAQGCHMQWLKTSVTTLVVCVWVFHYTSNLQHTNSPRLHHVQRLFPNFHPGGHHQGASVVFVKIIGNESPLAR